MRNYLSIICLGLILLLSCQRESSTGTPPSNEDLAFAQSDSLPAYTTPVAEAREAVQRYADLMREYDSALIIAKMPIPLNSPLKSFTVRAIDLIRALGMDIKYKENAKYKYVRVYIGMDESPQQFRLFLTPVVDANLDTIPAKPGKDRILYKRIKDADGNLLTDEGYVMDFAMPCPNTCPQQIL